MSHRSGRKPSPSTSPGQGTSHEDPALGSQDPPEVPFGSCLRCRPFR